MTRPKNMIRPVLITGPMRSGTSLVAQVVNRLGYHISPTIMAPAPPCWRSDWEDPVLTSRLIAGERPTPGQWREYMDARRRLSVKLGFGGRFAVKSPYLALAWDGLWAHAGSLDPLVIVTARWNEDRARSFEAQKSLSPEDNKAIWAALPTIKPHLVVRYEAAVESPLAIVQEIAKALGNADDAAVAAAAALIGKPTEYPALCPH